MDVNRLNRGEQIAGAAAILLFIDMFLSWYSVNINGALSQAAARLGVDTSATAWQAFSTTDLLLLLTIIVTLVMVGMRAMGRDADLPVSLPLVAAVLGGVMTLVVLYRIINQPGPNDVINVEYGAYIGLILIGALTYGAVQAGDGVEGLRADATRATAGAGTAQPAAATAAAGPVGATSVAEPPGPPPPAAPATYVGPTPGGDPAPPAPAPDPAPPAPAPDPAPPAPAPDPAPPAPAPDPQPPRPEPAPPQPGDDPAGPTA